MKRLLFTLSIAVGAMALAALVVSEGLALPGGQPQENPPNADGPPGPVRRRFEGGPPPGAVGPGRGFGMMREEIKLVDRFDADGDGRLNADERSAARKYLHEERSREDRGWGGRRGFPGPRGFGPGAEPMEAKPGERIQPADVEPAGNAPLYDPRTLRTLFLDFENADWETELADFKGTDVEVPARLTVDGKAYPDVGVHFRGASSFGMVGDGWKRSLNVSVDDVHDDQRLLGYRTLNLLNSHEDPTFLRTVLYLHIAREYLPAPKANFVRVVINGENWGVYVNAQQFNKDFLRDWFGTTKGARWKAPGSPRGRAGLTYLGDAVEEYKRLYEIKSKDDPRAWEDLVRLCKVLNLTPPDQLEEALAPILNIDGALKFLALENALINNDGYWIRSSDYSLYQDEAGRFHIFPHDANETFAIPGGPGFGRGMGRPGPGGPETEPDVRLDPLVAVHDSGKPLISRLLAVPALRERYLGYVRDIAERWLDWEVLGPLAREYQSVIEAEIEKDTRKLTTTEMFRQNLLEDVRTRGFGRVTIGLKNFADQRRAYLLKYTKARE